MTPEELAAQAAAAASTASTTPATGQSSTDFSALLQNGKILGKYSTPQEAAQGHWNLTNYAADLARANQELQARLAQATTPAPVTQSALNAAAAEAMVKPELLAAAIREIASTVVQDQMAPLTTSMQAHAILSKELPEYVKNQAAIEGFLETNPQLSALVAGIAKSGTTEAVAGAARLAFREWQASQVGTSTPAPAAVAAASLPGGTGSGPSGGAAAAQLTDEQRKAELAQAVQYARATGDERAVFSALFRDFNFFGPPQSPGAL